MASWIHSWWICGVRRHRWIRPRQRGINIVQARSSFCAILPLRSTCSVWWEKASISICSILRDTFSRQAPFLLRRLAVVNIQNALTAICQWHFEQLWPTLTTRRRVHPVRSHDTRIMAGCRLLSCQSGNRRNYLIPGNIYYYNWTVTNCRVLTSRVVCGGFYTVALYKATHNSFYLATVFTVHGQ